MNLHPSDFSDAGQSSTAAVAAVKPLAEPSVRVFSFLKSRYFTNRVFYTTEEVAELEDPVLAAFAGHQ